MTICKKCRWYKPERRHWGEKPGLEWYSRKCGYPDALEPVSICFETGRKIPFRERMPYCRDINDDGKCPHYQP